MYLKSHNNRMSSLSAQSIGYQKGGKFMLWQLHHQNRRNLKEHEMVAQSDLKSIEDRNKFIEDTKRNHPLPEGYQWLMCNEKSEHFI